MNTEQGGVRISSRELTYLKNTDFLPAELARVIDACCATGKNSYVVRVSRELAEQFRAAFTDRLAQVGFGSDYEPNSEGRILEELIDRFYLSSTGKG